MNKIAAVLLLLPAMLMGAPADKLDPKDFPLTAHVTRSETHTIFDTSLALVSQYLQASIGNQTVMLQSQPHVNGVLALGDYPARLDPKAKPPKSPNSYDIYQTYQLLLPDGTGRSYDVVGFAAQSR